MLSSYFKSPAISAGLLFDCVILRQISDEPRVSDTEQCTSSSNFSAVMVSCCCFCLVAYHSLQVVLTFRQLLREYNTPRGLRNGAQEDKKSFADAQDDRVGVQDDRNKGRMTGRTGGAGHRRTCPPPDRGRGRGPTTASLSEARTTMALGGAGVSEANGVPTGDGSSSLRNTTSCRRCGHRRRRGQGRCKRSR